MDAVLPLLGRDVERVRRLLLPSLAAHAGGIARIFVIVPDGDLTRVMAELTAELPFELVFLPESEVVPEERWFLRHRRGWWLQQLIKIAMFERVAGAFYLTLDCDLLCTRAWVEQDLVREGRAVLDRDSLRPGQNLPWYEQARDVLAMPIPSAGMSVTPVVYSVAVMRGLTQHLEGRVPQRIRVLSRLLPGVAGPRFRGWRMHLRRNIPWTEMSLYATYLEAAGLGDTFHHQSWDATLYGNNVWTRDQFDAWDVRTSLDGPCLFSVVGSKSGASVQEVVDKVAGSLPVA